MPNTREILEDMNISEEMEDLSITEKLLDALSEAIDQQGPIISTTFLEDIRSVYPFLFLYNRIELSRSQAMNRPKSPLSAAFSAYGLSSRHIKEQELGSAIRKVYKMDKKMKIVILDANHVFTAKTPIFYKDITGIPYEHTLEGFAETHFTPDAIRFQYKWHR